MERRGGDTTWIEAFERMSLDHGHAWRRHTEIEARWIIERVRPTDGARVVDVGCGDGRHVEAFITAGLDARGVDIAPGLVDRARAARPQISGSFSVCDARRESPGQDIDLITCLYDVLGSSARLEDDRDLLANLVAALRPGGFLVGSVMNAEATLALLPGRHLPSSRTDLELALEELPASHTMEETGCVFDPDLIVAYEGVFYRKERFADADGPTEYLLTDRRFTAAEVRAMLEEVGLKVEEVRPVQAGRWDRDPVLAAESPQAKELLFVARRP